MNEIDKLTLSIEKLQPSSQFVFKGDVVSEERFNSIEWHTENTLTWSEVNAEMDRLQTEYDAQDYARKRKEEYPMTKEFIEAYTEKEIGGDDTKWNEYVTKYNKVRTDNPKE